MLILQGDGVAERTPRTFEKVAYFEPIALARLGSRWLSLTLLGPICLACVC